MSNQDGGAAATRTPKKEEKGEGRRAVSGRRRRLPWVGHVHQGWAGACATPLRAPPLGMLGVGGGRARGAGRERGRVHPYYYSQRKKERIGALFFLNGGPHAGAPRRTGGRETRRQPTQMPFGNARFALLKEPRVTPRYFGPACGAARTLTAPVISCVAGLKSTCSSSNSALVGPRGGWKGLFHRSLGPRGHPNPTARRGCEKGGGGGGVAMPSTGQSREIRLF